MIRAILSIIVSYIVLAVVTALSLTVAWIVIGEDGAFVDDTWLISPKWSAAMLGVGLVAGVVGGFVCHLIARSKKVIIVFAVFVLVLAALGSFYNHSMQHEKPTRPDDLKMFEATNSAKQPPLVLYLNPLLNTIGVIIGGGLRSDKRATPTQ